MPICWTLQWYIAREMGKTCILAGLALAGVFGLGGGLVHMIKLGDATPDQLTRVMMLVLPAAGALTLPIAVMFAATCTYGRLSADNELVACRSGGINIHVLFLPTLVFSLLCAAITFSASNFVIPGMARNLQGLIEADLPKLLEQRLNHPRGMALPNGLRLCADTTEIDPENPSVITLRNVVFIEMEKESWQRFGSARSVLLQINRSDNDVALQAELVGASFYDRSDQDFGELGRWALGSDSLPPVLPQEIKFLTLAELWRLQSDPGTWGKVVDRVRRLREAVGARMFHDGIAEAFTRDGQVTLADADRTLRIQAAVCRQNPRDGEVELTDVVVEVTRHRENRAYQADRAVFGIDFVGGSSLAAGTIEIDLYEGHAVGGGGNKRRKKITLGPVAAYPVLLSRIAALSEEELLAEPAVSLPGDPVVERRKETVEARRDTVRRARAAVHERMSYSFSVFGLVVLGAALGIRFRGAHVATAFGLSFVPALCVIIAIVMGKQMAHNAATHLLGLGLMWSGLVAVIAVDFVALTRMVRR